MKLKFNIDINTMYDWYRYCKYCIYFDKSEGWHRGCSIPNKKHIDSTYMECYDNGGNLIPGLYSCNFISKLKYKKL